MPKVLADLMASKKALASMAGLLSAVLVLIFGDSLGLSPELADKVAGAIVVHAAAYVTAQGQADRGKEAVKATPAPEPRPF